ncbi:hypothetical protein ACPPVU_23615 [Mucilaginibacter sp. McL0603]|uniref:hypothetical protein n=1 Tax=Mucilaginibacter sp. McL0603 TaxID=3415670 RepID=UPI003CFA3720
MKIIFNLALAGMIVLAGCNKTAMKDIAPVTTTKGSMTSNTTANLNSNPNGSGGIILVYYDGNLFQMNSKQFTDQPASSLLANNKSINILYESDGFVTVTDAIQGGGPGYNALWQEVDIVFNTGFAPHQFLTDNDILPAAAGPNPEITLVPTTEIYRCAIVQHTKVQ